MRLALALAALVVAAGPAVAVETGGPETACLKSALSDYLDRETSILQSPNQQFGMEASAVIARRRLQESYCMTSTACLFTRDGSKQSELVFGTEFATCLDEEEKNRPK